MGRHIAAVDAMVVHCADAARLPRSSAMKELLLVGAGLVLALLAWLGAKGFGKGKKVSQPGTTEEETRAREEVTKTLIDKAKVSAKTDVEVKKLEEIEKMPESPDKLKAAANAIRDL